jgi:hypothetical protein
MNGLIKWILLGGYAVSFAVHAHNGVDHAKHAHAVAAPSMTTPGALHGGVVHEVNGIHYELVAAGGSLSLYLFKQGKPVDVKGMAAIATLISGNAKEDVRLLSKGINRLEAKPKTPLPGNVTALVNVAKPDNSAVRIQFVLK